MLFNPILNQQEDFSFEVAGYQEVSIKPIWDTKTKPRGYRENSPSRSNIMSDTGILTINKDEAGRWIEHEKDGRKRTTFMYLKDVNSRNPDEDKSYIGYYYDANKVDVGCNLALSINNKTIDLQIVKPGSKEVGFKSWTHEEFMNLLDLLLK